MNALNAARAYLAKLPPAICGAGGSLVTFRAACECVRFGLADGDAMTLLREYGQRCQPPWSEKELAHKLKDARRKAGGQSRHYSQPRPSVRLVWKIERKTPKPDIATPSPAVSIPAPPPAEANREPREKDAEFTKGKTTVCEIVQPSTPASVRIVRDCDLPLDQAAWLPVARQVLAGEFDGADRSAVESLVIGMRSIDHPLCRGAIEKLPRKPKSGRS